MSDEVVYVCMTVSRTVMLCVFLPARFSEVCVDTSLGRQQ